MANVKHFAIRRTVLVGDGDVGRYGYTNDNESRDDRPENLQAGVPVGLRREPLLVWPPSVPNDQVDQHPLHEDEDHDR